MRPFPSSPISPRLRQLTRLSYRNSDLEQAVESLAELLERPVIEGKIPELRQLMTDKAAYVARRCQIMLEDTLRGYDEVSPSPLLAFVSWKEA